MKYILTILVLIGAVFCQNVSAGQVVIFDCQMAGISVVITDKIIWETIEVDSNFVGDTACVHEWVNSNPKTQNTMNGIKISCAIDHKGFHCSWDNRYRNRICKLCMRKEYQHERWYQHQVIQANIDYKVLENKLKGG